MVWQNKKTGKWYDCVVEIMAKNSKDALKKFKKDKTRLSWCKDITIRKSEGNSLAMMKRIPAKGYYYYNVYFNYK